MKERKLILVYLALVAIWLGVCAWQYHEHRAAREQARLRLREQVQDISKTLSIVIRSQDWGPGARRRLEAALKELVTSTELQTVMLLNSAGEMTATFGQAINIPPAQLLQDREIWQRGGVIFVNPVALGGHVNAENNVADSNPLVPRMNEGIASQLSYFRAVPSHLNRPGFMLRWNRTMTPEAKDKLQKLSDNRPYDEAKLTAFLACFKPGVLSAEDQAVFRQVLRGKSISLQKITELVNFIGLVKMDNATTPMSRAHLSDYRELLKKQGIHWCVVMVPTTSVERAIQEDWKIRLIIPGIALLAVIAAGVAVRTLFRAFQLELHWTRARDAANYLKDQNMAAVGLVHETKNPLNVIRGQTQIIAMNHQIPADVRRTATAIIDEVDRVSGRLTQFLDYSKPRPPELHPVPFGPLADELLELLKIDGEEKQLRLERTGANPVLAADRDQLRQLLFNLLLNAIQAVPAGTGHITLDASIEDGSANIRVGDNGPGIPANLREEIFRPYFTTNAAGTGLGLSIVRKIALAHHWNIQLTDAEPGHTVFTLSRLQLYSASEENRHAAI